MGLQILCKNKKVNDTHSLKRSNFSLSYIKRIFARVPCILGIPAYLIMLKIPAIEIYSENELPF